MSEKSTEQPQLDTAKPIVEVDVPDDVVDRLKSMSEEDKAVADMQVIPNPDVKEEDKGVEIKFDEKSNKTADVDGKEGDAKGGKEGDAKGGKEGDAKGGKEGDAKDGKEDEAKPKGEEKDDAKGDDKGVIELTLHGKTKKYTAHELKAAVGRQAAFERRVNEMRKSDEMRLGTLLKAAEDGDKSAMKKVQNLLLKASGKESIDDLSDDLDEVTDEFDESKVLSEQEKKAQEDEFFGDVRDSVDFQSNMDKVNTTLKERIPAKVYEAFSQEPATKRAMYDLVASGRDEELLSQLEEHVQSLPFEKQLEIETDPAAFGAAFTLVVRRANAARNKESDDKAGSESDGLDSVSGGTKSPDVQRGNQTGPDFLSMSEEEFKKFQEKHGLD